MAAAGPASGCRTSVGRGIFHATLTAVLNAISVPADHERGPLYAEQFLAAVHLGNVDRLPLTLAFARHAGEVTLCCRHAPALRGLIEGQLYAQYPDARLRPLPEETLDAPPGTVTWEAEIHLHHELFPLRRYGQFDDPHNARTADPLTAILVALTPSKGQPLHPVLTITVRPAARRRIRRARRTLEHLSRPLFRHHPRLGSFYVRLGTSRSLALRLAGRLLGGWGRGSGAPAERPLETSASRLHDREEDLQAGSDKLGRPLFEAHLLVRVSAPPEAQADAREKLRELIGSLGHFHAPRLARFHAGRVRRRRRVLRRRARGFLLSAEELATLWHPPTAAVRAPTMTVVQSREAEAPVQLPGPADHSDLALLGVATFRERRQPCGLLPDDRRRHLVIEGKTGMGKSTLLLQLLRSDIRRGRGVGLLDPHGDLCDAVLAAVPARRTNDVVLLDAGDSGHPVAFNVLACPDPRRRPLLAAGIVAAFRKLYGEFWGPRLEHVLRNALLALLETPDASLLSVLRFLGDRRYREALLGRVGDPVVRGFWEREFAAWPPKLQAEAVAPVQNKIGHFVSNPLLRNIVGQPRSSVDLRRAMDEGKILLMNLSKGRVGEDASALLGSFLVTALQLAAMGRAEVAEEHRPDFYLYVDEFQNFATQSFATILSEARKYRLNLVLANQYLAQMDEATRAAVFGNIGSLVVFQVGAEDSEFLAQQLGGTVRPSDLLALPRYHAYVRLLIDGQPSRPFSLQTLPPSGARDPQRPAIIRRYTRQRYARPAVQVEREIARTALHV